MSRPHLVDDDATPRGKPLFPEHDGAFTRYDVLDALIERTQVIVIIHWTITQRDVHSRSPIRPQTRHRVTPLAPPILGTYSLHLHIEYA
jgi:hypothetical protein